MSPLEEKACRRRHRARRADASSPWLPAMVGRPSPRCRSIACSAAVTGYGGTTQVAHGAPRRARSSALVTVRFDANIAPGMPWQFRPKQPSMSLSSARPGSRSTRSRTIRRPADGGQAGYNVSPDPVGGYFDKIACFCFAEQVLQAHERVGDGRSCSSSIRRSSRTRR